MLRSSLAILSLITLCTACGTAVEQNYQVATQDARDKAVCGGIAGFQCPTGQKCLIKDDYPDAMGTCVGKPEKKQWEADCALVRCAYLECPAGYELKFGPGNCCGECRPTAGKKDSTPEGYCTTPSDCDGLVHIMCVGAWSCEQNSCVYSCDSTPL